MNFSVEMKQTATLAKKLIARTQEGKIAWEAKPLIMMSAVTPDVFKSTRFVAFLENALSATIIFEEKDKLAFISFLLIERVDADLMTAREKELLSVRVDVDPPYGFDTAEQKQLSKTLVELYELARRSALKIDASVNKALEYLDKLAV